MCAMPNLSFVLQNTTQKVVRINFHDDIRAHDVPRTFTNMGESHGTWRNSSITAPKLTRFCANSHFTLVWNSTLPKSPHLQKLFICHNGLLFVPACNISKLNICKINNIIGHSAELAHKRPGFLTSGYLKKGRIYQTEFNRDACPKGILNGSQFGLLPHLTYIKKTILKTKE